MKSQLLESTFFVESIPILLILLFTLYTKSMIEISYTVLGKLIAVFLIIGYSVYDVLYGLIICAIVILYYQLDSIECMENETPKNRLNYMQNSNTDTIISNDISPVSVVDITTPTHQVNAFNITTPTHQVNAANITTQSTEEHNNSSITQETATSSQEGLITNYYDFQKKNCRNSQLFYKEYPIKNDMVEHIFPEIRFDSNICNPCDPNCKISFINNKITTESNLVLPKSSNDFFYDSWKDIFGKENTFFPRLESLSETFTKFIS